MRRLLAGHFRREDSRYDNALAPTRNLCVRTLVAMTTQSGLPTLAGAHEEGH